MGSEGMHPVQGQLNRIWQGYEREAKGLGVAYHEIFLNESALTSDCFDAISEHVSSADITRAGSARVREWVVGMMSQIDGDADEIWGEYIDEDLPDFMELHAKIAARK